MASGRRYPDELDPIADIIRKIGLDIDHERDRLMIDCLRFEASGAVDQLGYLAKHNGPPELWQRPEKNS